MGMDITLILGKSELKISKKLNTISRLILLMQF